MVIQEKINQIAKWIANSKHLVAFTGAGISTESGVPDFRGPDGVWTRRDKGLPPPKMEKEWSEVTPNRGHLALVELQNIGLLKFLISQNVDGLHLMSGIKPEILAELHGNSKLMVCLSCESLDNNSKKQSGSLTEVKMKTLSEIPKEYGELKAVTTHAAYEGWSQLWFIDEEKTIRMVRVQFHENRFHEYVLVIPRN